VTWPKWSGTRTVETVEAPQVTEACLALKLAPDRRLWVPLHTITGPIEVEVL
jgi:hypothetical protein